MADIALQYTLIGMGVVFIVLLFISFVISLFKIISKTPPQEAAQALEKAAAPESSAVDGNDVLAVVIAAAVKAFEDAHRSSGDGYVVRSIKRI